MKHKIDLHTKSVQDEGPVAKKSKIPQYFSQVESMNIKTKISRLCAIGDLDFECLATNSDIRQVFKADGYDFPKNHTSIRDLVIKSTHT